MAIATAKPSTSGKKINLSEVEAGDVFSEASHYIYNGKKLGTSIHQFLHLESNKVVNLDENYVADLLQTADQYASEVEVGREDKHWTAKQIAEAEKQGLLTKGATREGDLRQKGIRTLWSEIHSAQVFTVAFYKQSKELSQTAQDTARATQLTEALQLIMDAQKNKKGVAKVAEEAIKKIQANPIIPIEKGDERVLRGYKTQFESITGHYNVIDMDIKAGNAQRQVNVTEIIFLVYNNVKYIVK